MNVFAFRPGRSLKNCDAQRVGLELERIRKDVGTLTAETVLEAAKDDASPLHAAFEWDDSAAAHQHRLNQARRLIVSVRIINQPVQTIVPAFVSVRKPEGRQYVPTAEAMTDEEMKARVLAEVRQFIESMERRYQTFQHVADMLAKLKQNVA